MPQKLSEFTKAIKTIKIKLIGKQEIHEFNLHWRLHLPAWPIACCFSLKVKKSVLRNWMWKRECHFWSASRVIHPLSFCRICREHSALPAGLRAHPDAGVQPAAASVAAGSTQGGARAERELQLRLGHLGAAVAVPGHKTGAPSDPRLAPPLAPLAHNQILLPRTTGWPRCCWLDYVCALHTCIFHTLLFHFFLIFTI